jgi:hypothetical protein
MGSGSGCEKCAEVRFCLFDGPLFQFCVIFDPFCRKSPFLRPDFSIFDSFSIPEHGILANRTRGCTIAHRQQELKPRNWAPEVAVFYFVDLGVKALVSLGPVVIEYSRDISLVLMGPTSSTHHSSARGGGLDTLFPSFFPLFWVAK